MADNYMPLYLPGDAITLTASADVAAGDPVEVSGSGTVAKAAGANSAAWVGIVAFDAKANAKVTVYGRGTVHEGKAEGGITAGNQVVASSTTDRQVKALPATSVTFAGTYTAADAKSVVDAAVNAARAVIGVALITATTGNLCRWMSF